PQHSQHLIIFVKKSVAIPFIKNLNKGLPQSMLFLWYELYKLSLYLYASNHVNYSQKKLARIKKDSG
ncbi:MAG: hypothetical protein ACTH9D_08505, partial [Enterococcus viikkiensis]